MLARRLVADRCLYGVDCSPMAVEMAKLSLWLVTLGERRPFKVCLTTHSVSETRFSASRRLINLSTSIFDLTEGAALHGEPFRPRRRRYPLC